jgi:hypothetical protein
LTASISAFWADAGAINPTKNAITSAMLRMINSIFHVALDFQ